MTIQVAYIRGWLYDNHGVDGLFVGRLAVFSGDIVSDLLRLFLLGETLEVAQGKAQEESSVGHAARPLEESFIKAFEGIREMPKTLAALMVVWTFGAFAGSDVGPFWSLQILNIIGLWGVQQGTTSMVQSALALFLGFPLGRISGKYGRRKVTFSP